MFVLGFHLLIRRWEKSARLKVRGINLASGTGNFLAALADAELVDRPYFVDFECSVHRVVAG